MFLGSIAEYIVDVEEAGEWLVEVPNPAESGFFESGGTVFVTPSRPSIHLLHKHISPPLWRLEMVLNCFAA